MAGQWELPELRRRFYQWFRYTAGNIIDTWQSINCRFSSPFECQRLVGAFNPHTMLLKNHHVGEISWLCWLDPKFCWYVFLVKSPSQWCWNMYLQNWVMNLGSMLVTCPAPWTIWAMGFQTIPIDISTIHHSEITMKSPLINNGTAGHLVDSPRMGCYADSFSARAGTSRATVPFCSMKYIDATW